MTVRTETYKVRPKKKVKYQGQLLFFSLDCDKNTGQMLTGCQWFCRKNSSPRGLTPAVNSVSTRFRHFLSTVLCAARDWCIGPVRLAGFTRCLMVGDAGNDIEQQSWLDLCGLTYSYYSDLKFCCKTGCKKQQKREQSRRSWR